MPQPPETFTTARLSARPARVADAPEAYAAYANDPIVTRYLAWKAYDDVKGMEEFLARNEEVWRTGVGHRMWLLRLRVSNEVAGAIGMSIHNHATLFGYVLGQKYWRRGLMAEALTYLVDWSLAQPEIYRAWAYCDVANDASARVMEKAGMRREGIFQRWHVCPTIGPEPRDCIVCAKARGA